MKDHPYAPAELDHVHRARIYIFSIKLNAPFQAGTRNQIVHSVQRPEKGRLSASGRPDQRRHKARANPDGHVLKRLLHAVKEIGPVDTDFYLVAHRRIRFLIRMAVILSRKVRTSSTNTVE